MRFIEDWYSAGQLNDLCRLYEHVRNSPGITVEFGCWQGKSTVELAKTCFPERICAVDHWRGNLDEDPNHVSVALGRKRDVYAEFLSNIGEYARGNVDVFRMDWRDFIEELLAQPKGPIKFCHIDASHDYRSVRDNIAAVLPLLGNCAVICGDDFQSASAARLDLEGGVERAVRELLPEFQSIGNLWYWLRGAA